MSSHGPCQDLVNNNKKESVANLRGTDQVTVPEDNENVESCTLDD